MTKQELLNKISTKVGFHSVISDELTSDNKSGDPIQKRALYINHQNSDGTMGKTYIYYLHDNVNDIASFYNNEIEVLDSKEPTSEQKKINALEEYLNSKYASYFINRFDLNQNVAEADVYTLSAGKLSKKTVLVFKKGNNPINDLDVI